ncbi:EAL domain-containing protein [Paraburkholderia dioscoreae]|uniref:EAL domain-containing protein n=2 Tax=Paraburkholderia dioscoreae TaxID=2604047 RepID=A0A5Q4Z349_9BURK|nr:EAL domain-containing protein [Paraburkholderia dioscoreae]
MGLDQGASAALAAVAEAWGLSPLRSIPRAAHDLSEAGRSRAVLPGSRISQFLQRTLISHGIRHCAGPSSRRILDAGAQTIAWRRENALPGRRELHRAAIHNNRSKGLSCTMKGESESFWAKFADPAVPELQRGRTQWLLPVALTVVLTMTGAHAQEHRALISDTATSLQSAQSDQSDTDCMSPPLALIPATLAGATATPMKLVDGARLACSFSADVPKPEAGVRRSSPGRATDVPQPVTGPVEDSADAELAYMSGLPSVASGPAFTGLVPETSSSSPPEEDLDLTGPTGCERGQACEGGAAPGEASESAQPEPEPDVRPVAGARTRVSRRLLVGLAAWLALWLMTCLLIHCAWMFYKRHLTPDAKLIRAAKAGIKRGEFRVEYQPLVSLSEGRCVGVDALIRWDNVEYGQLGPHHYMSRIEQRSFIGPVTRFILSTAVRELGPLVASRSLYIGIKVAARHVESPTFVSDVIGSAESILSRLVLHLPEEHCARPTKGVLDAVTMLRARGVRLAMSGATSVEMYSTLHEAFHFDLLKIDRRILALDDGERRQRLAALVDAARELGSIVVAEGVESASHHRVVSRSGAEIGQGFFYGRTMILSLLVTFLNAGGNSLRGKKVRLWQ